ncbi:MAG: shikimate dehydrogenase [Rhodanobacteraceae bacterium]
MTPRYAVFGQPIAHSLSPRIHAMFAAQLGIALDYRAIEASLDTFASKLDAFADEGGAGANVTLPLKQEAARLCMQVSDRARRADSVNTLIRDGDGWRGDSTDGIGFVRDLRDRHRFEPRDKRVLLLGAGGAARAVAFALIESDAELTIANRTRARAEVLADAARSRVVDWSALAESGRFDLVVHATAAGHADASPGLPDASIGAGALAYDLSYGAAAAPFLSWAQASGARAIDGLGMLVEQAAESFAIWHGDAPATDPVYAALRAAR